MGNYVKISFIVLYSQVLSHLEMKNRSLSNIDYLIVQLLTYIFHMINSLVLCNKSFNLMGGHMPQIPPPPPPLDRHQVSIELSDRFELSDTIHFHINKWSVNAWNSQKCCITLSLLILVLKRQFDSFFIYKIGWCPIIRTCLIIQYLSYSNPSEMFVHCMNELIVKYNVAKCHYTELCRAIA